MEQPTSEEIYQEMIKTTSINTDTTEEEYKYHTDLNSEEEEDLQGETEDSNSDSYLSIIGGNKTNLEETTTPIAD